MAARIDLDRIDLETHVLREGFGDPKRWGIPAPITPEWRLAAGSLSQLMIGANGKVSASEREAMMSKPALRTLLGPMLYAHVGIMRADGFADEERLACRKLCKALGVDPSIVVPIEMLLQLDDVALQNRHRLIAPPVDLANAGAGPMIQENGPARAREYGFGPGPMPRDFARRFGESALLVAGADGNVSDAELTWLVAHLRTLGAPRDLLEELVRFDPATAKIGDIVDARMKPFAKAVLLLGLRAARADGISPRERGVAEQGAKLLGLDHAFVTALECQLRTEDALREARIKLLTESLPAK